MICANCDHPGGDHIDRAFGGRYCAPPANATGWTTVRCLCPGFRPMSAFEAEMAVLRQTRPWAAFVRQQFAAALPWLTFPAHTAEYGPERGIGATNGVGAGPSTTATLTGPQIGDAA